MHKYLITCLVLLLISCGDDDSSNFPDSLFDANRQIGSVESPQLTEISGIVSSRSTEGVLWAHNDKGDGARIYMLHESGRHLGIFYLEGIAARDWEDIAIGPGPQPDKNYIYIADIGDNDEISKVLYIYRFLEPSVENLDFPTEQTITDIDVIEVVYDDKPRDAETLLIDPLTKDLLIVTKSKKASEVFNLPYPQSLTRRNRLVRLAQLPFDTAVGGDVSADGLEILIKNYENIYYWKKRANQGYAQVFSQDPVILPYHEEPQGEAIGWKADGTGYYTISEEANNRPSPVYFFSRN